MTSERTITVSTFGGWGWADSEADTAWDYVPPPFQAAVLSEEAVWFGKTVPTLRGRVTDNTHPMYGFSVLLSPRHEPWDGDVNVTLESEAGRKLKGFGSVDQASFE